MRDYREAHPFEWSVGYSCKGCDVRSTISDGRIWCPFKGDQEYQQRSCIWRKLPDGSCNCRCIRNRRIWRGGSRYAVLSGRRMVPEICSQQIKSQYHRFDEHYAGICKYWKRWTDRSGRTGDSCDRWYHHRAAGWKSSSRWYCYRRWNICRYSSAYRWIRT